MYALKPPSPPPQHRRVSRVTRQAKPRQRNSHRAIAWETTAKLTVNIVLSVAAVTALAQLLPYRSSQEVKLQELDAAVQSTHGRVQREQAKFSYYFDPYHARENMQELTDRIDPLRRRIIWKASVTTPTPVKPSDVPKN